METIYRIISGFFLMLRKILQPRGVLAVVAENLALKQQLLVVKRKLKRAPKLKIGDRFILAWTSLFINPIRFSKIAVILKPATFLKLHKSLVKHKYRVLFSKHSYKKTGPKGPDPKIVELILEMKKRNPRFGYRRIAMQVSHSLNIEIDKDVVRRILAKSRKFLPGGDGPSWLSFFGNMKDSLWSVDLFRSESILLKSHWVMVILDLFTRRIIGFAVHNEHVDGPAICYMFNKIIFNNPIPKYLSSDHDPLFRFHQWLANLRILGIEEIKSVPYVPSSHPYVERLIGTVRRELLDQIFFWNQFDLQNKLNNFAIFYNHERCHFGLSGGIPIQKAFSTSLGPINLHNHSWKKHCNGLIELPVAA